MAQVNIAFGPLSVQIEDEDRGYKSLSRKAHALILDLSESLSVIRDLEDEEDGDDEVFCDDCGAGTESSEHFQKCEIPLRRAKETVNG